MTVRVFATVRYAVLENHRVTLFCMLLKGCGSGDNDAVFRELGESQPVRGAR